jgi:hypothetical protein
MHPVRPREAYGGRDPDESLSLQWCLCEHLPKRLSLSRLRIEFRHSPVGFIIVNFSKHPVTTLYQQGAVLPMPPNPKLM